MAQILYNYPAMMAHAGEMTGYSGALHTIGAGISSEQGALAAGWTGDTGMSYQSWQTQWNTGLEELIAAYRQMTDAHENNTMNMMGADGNEAAKWV
ncbi:MULTISPECIES: WXG100 family type VII secretion target [Mycobacterium]|jgi:WXG100 family type VII secretion target|uniref:ESAT-6-like protein n=1 Tax=Mycobacterium paragordonae TaxID=1389713 RepID=A0AAJ1W4A7_9MYCO|nr:MULTISPECIES: WXG100 family type VII secretion target [Mycobacterium]MBI2699718.1 WXG100 family type VII secretion target [Mycobacterium sp.]MDP7739235.1 WXG100 family type VII secretion target [Mycobacterium paragordonae]PJE02608.1 MAG: WXG100 family type VII secretion target [Mycobacterium sp.]PJE10701.1 MAG: WXG100 family type VII secretion target [Mycobacterium sp.]PJE25351.1 MAG: WXG100 family type VII secretion target [Mycobacterium sp.]